MARAMPGADSLGQGRPAAAGPAGQGGGPAASGPAGQGGGPAASGPAGQARRETSGPAAPRITSPVSTGPANAARCGRVAVALAGAGLLISAGGYAADMATHAHGLLLNWFDLRVYAQAGLLARHNPADLYSWQLSPVVRFTYPPFAALVFAVVSVLPAVVLHWAMTAASGAALAVTGWLTFTALGWRGRDRITASLVLTALTLWTEPVLRALELGQIELLLMALIAWDLCQPDHRTVKGIGIGLAAGIKLVPLIFIPYLLICGRRRQATTAAATFAATAAVGFAVLPQASATWWLTGYFLRANKAGGVPSLVNQSLFALIARAMGGASQATSVWLAAAAVTAVAGLAAAAALHRSGRPVAGWIVCALTGVLVSPISWDHHWVWIVPVLILLADRAVRARRVARWGYLAAFAAVAGVFGGWPGHWTGPDGLVPHGLVGFFVGAHTSYQLFHLHGLQVIGWNLFVLAGLLMLAVAIAAAARLGGPQLPHRPRALARPRAKGRDPGADALKGRTASECSYPGSR
jgi:alpha-1,2-mannosyltransferase